MSDGGRIAVGQAGHLARISPGRREMAAPSWRPFLRAATTIQRSPDGRQAVLLEPGAGQAHVVAMNPSMKNYRGNLDDPRTVLSCPCHPVEVRTMYPTGVEGPHPRGEIRAHDGSPGQSTALCPR